MSENAIKQAEEQAKRTTQRPGALLPLAVSPKHDVQFIIGETRSGRDERGEKVTRNLVNQSHFEKWTTAALFLNTAGPDAILTTRAAGDLLLAPQFRGQVYLKGLLLKESTSWQSASITGRPLRYGYNLSTGITNRERTSVASADEEGRAILAIWDSVLQEHPDSWPEMAALFSDMLNTEDPEYADVFKAKYLTKDMAEALKTHLLDGPRQYKWYYQGKEKSEVSGSLCTSRVYSRRKLTECLL